MNMMKYTDESVRNAVRLCPNNLPLLGHYWPDADPESAV